MLKPLPFDFKMGLVFMVVLEQLDIYSVRLNVPLGEGSFRVNLFVRFVLQDGILLTTHLL